MDTLDCWVYGQDVGRIFLVEIPEPKTVGALKNAIKNEQFQSFRDVEADRLDLYFIPDSDSEPVEDRLEKIQLDTLKRLGSRTKIPEDFAKGVIVVKGPEPTSGACLFLCSLALLMFLGFRRDRASRRNSKHVPQLLGAWSGTQHRLSRRNFKYGSCRNLEGNHQEQESGELSRCRCRYSLPLQGYHPF